MSSYRSDGMIEVSDLGFAYAPGQDIFSRFGWQAAAGEAWAIIGPSGCGKTTLLYLLAGLRRPRQGHVRVEGRPLTGPRAATGLILQDYGLLPWFTARDNVALGLRIRGVAEKKRRELAGLWLERLGLLDVADRYPSQLSGGQRQRVAIARTLALGPDLLLMDEPFSSLDAITREDLQDLVLSLGIEGQATTILVTHNIEEAVYLAGRILVLPQPPIHEARVIENPGGGHLGYRHEASFHEKCEEVRGAIEKAPAARVGS
ncbi:MAG: ABC transporter ATP-binding protein [Dehalococcoidales bacterium]|nr:ABC transporter ATP-binding protein [Dehalococcoidales bacterium]